MSEKYTGSNFSVLIAPIELRGNFSSVSGLGAEMEYEVYNEGGNFTAPVLLPRGMKYQNIVLERGTMSAEPLSIWFTQLQTGIQTRLPMIITMMDSTGVPVKIWTVLDAMPVKVDYSPMNAMSGSVATTTVEFSHGEIITIL